MRRERLGPLDVVVAGGSDGEGGGDGPVVVLLHGFGAPGDDLVPLWRVLDVPRSTRFAFPAAPVGLPEFMGGRAWWLIPAEYWEDPGRDRSGEIPAGLSAARASVVAMLDDLQRRLAPPSIVLGGFSQGAMLSVDVCAHDGRPLAGLALLSGTLIAAPLWAPRLPSRRGLPVLQSHGSADPLLVPAGADRLRACLTEAGLDVEWHPFRGGHEIPQSVVEALGAFITRVTTA
jgi:phospholipase/carboxylesterase